MENNQYPIRLKAGSSIRPVQSLQLCMQHDGPLKCHMQGRIQSLERGGGHLSEKQLKTKKLAEIQLKTKKKKKKKKKGHEIIASYPYQLYHVCYVK